MMGMKEIFVNVVKTKLAMKEKTVIFLFIYSEYLLGVDDENEGKICKCGENEACHPGEGCKIIYLRLFIRL